MAFRYMNIFYSMKVYGYLTQGGKKRLSSLSASKKKKIPLGYWTVIIPLSNDIFTSILPEDLGIQRSPRLGLHMANKIFPLMRDFYLKRDYCLLSQLPSTKTHRHTKSSPFWYSAPSKQMSLPWQDSDYVIDNILKIQASWRCHFHPFGINSSLFQF